MPDQLRDSVLTFVREYSLSIFFIAFLIASCTDECPRQGARDEIFIASQSTSIMLEIESSADGSKIPVYLALPSTGSTFKAVVVLHGSGGPWEDDDTNGDGIGDVCNVGSLSKQNKEWEALLLSNNYAVAFPDSYSTRNTCENEGDYKVPPLKFKISGTFVRNQDAQDVFRLLSKLTWEHSNQAVIDVNNIAVIGFSDGATALLSTVYDEASTPANWLWKQSFNGVTYTKEILAPVKKVEPGFKVGVAYYPGAYHNGYYGNLCDAGGIYQSYCDIMFHLAGDDPLTENSECLIATMNDRGGGKPIPLRYESAGHGFDGNDKPESTTARTKTMLYINEVFDR